MDALCTHCEIFSINTTLSTSICTLHLFAFWLPYFLLLLNSIDKFIFALQGRGVWKFSNFQQFIWQTLATMLNSLCILHEVTEFWAHEKLLIKRGKKGRVGNREREMVEGKSWINSSEKLRLFIDESFISYCFTANGMCVALRLRDASEGWHLPLHLSFFPFPPPPSHLMDEV